MNTWARKQTGFTIVELLIVIVVIGILAAITIVAFNGVQNKAKASAAQSMAAQASKKVLAYAAQNSDMYPPDLVTAGITDPQGLEYSYNNDVSPRTYGVTATKGDISYYVSSVTSQPTFGGYAGHASGGVATITNIISNPGFETNTATWTVAGAATTSTTRTTTQFHSGVASLQAVSDGTASKQGVFISTLRPTISPNTTYTASIWLKGEAGKLLAVEFGEITPGGTLIGRTQPAAVTATGNWQRFVITRAMGATAGQADIVVRNNNAVAHTYYLDDAMITEGATTYNYADGNSSNWAWSGTVNNSASTGIPL